jgi:hypothetical protein
MRKMKTAYFIMHLLNLTAIIFIQNISSIYSFIGIILLLSIGISLIVSEVKIKNNSKMVFPIALLYFISIAIYLTRL